MTAAWRLRLQFCFISLHSVAVAGATLGICPRDFCCDLAPIYGDDSSVRVDSSGPDLKCRLPSRLHTDYSFVDMTICIVLSSCIVVLHKRESEGLAHHSLGSCDDRS